MNDVSVVICAYTLDRWSDLLAAIESVRNQTLPPREIIVVVDHNPNLLDRARANLSGVVVVENNQTRGLGGARNSGITVAQSSIIAFLDDDAIASPDWIKELSAPYADPLIAGVGGSILPAWQAGRPGWFPEEFDWVVGCSYRGLPQGTRVVRNLIGANMSYRREVFDTIGHFRLGYGCDETEFCIRLHRKWPHMSLLYHPPAWVSHLVPASRGTWRHFSTRCYFEGGSKAVVSWLQGSQAGLASERAYTLKTLPAGILRGLKDSLTGADRAGIARSSAILSGLLITTAGYLAGKLHLKDAARRRGWTGPVEGRVA